MTRNLPLGLMALAMAPGCVVYAYDHEVNDAPYVEDAAAYVYYDEFYRDDIWVFEAVVDDPNGVYDIIGVWADVYDEWGGGRLVESFELYPTDDPFYWYSEWYGSTTNLDPFWPGYTVDFVVYDTSEDFGWLTVAAETY